MINSVGFIFKVIVIMFFLVAKSEAHQPKLIYNSPSESSPYIISEPEISKAFYGKLNGNPHFFKISSDTDFLFYAGILTPKNSNNYISVSLDVIKNDIIIFKADGESFNWSSWYEPYARDYYWKGPEIGSESNKEFKTSFKIDKGEYLLKVYNKKNIGHYSLAVGEAEFFGNNLWEKILTWTPILFYIGPYMDIVHWQKFDVKAYIPHIFLTVLFFICFLIYRKLFYK